MNDNDEKLALPEAWEKYLAQHPRDLPRKDFAYALKQPVPDTVGYRKIALLQEKVLAWNVETSALPGALFRIEGRYPLRQLPPGKPALPPPYIDSILVYCNADDPPALWRREEKYIVRENQSEARGFARRGTLFRKDVFFVGRARWLWDEEGMDIRPGALTMGSYGYEAEDILGFRLRTFRTHTSEDWDANREVDFQWASQKLAWLWQQAFPGGPDPHIVPGLTEKQELTTSQKRVKQRRMRAAENKQIDPAWLRRKFSGHFEMYQDVITLPDGVVERREDGVIEHPHWTIHYFFGVHPEYGEYMQYQTIWKKANNRTMNWRIYGSQYDEVLPPYICETCGEALDEGSCMCAECASDFMFRLINEAKSFEKPDKKEL